MIGFLRRCSEAHWRWDWLVFASVRCTHYFVMPVPLRFTNPLAFPLRGNQDFVLRVRILEAFILLERLT